MSDRWYDAAQVCQSGHVITAYVKASPHKMTKFCNRCGEPTMTKCPHCEIEIRGAYHSNVAVADVEFKAPAFCHACGKPYPWTEATLKAAQGLAAEQTGLSPEERETLAKSLPDIIRDTPRTSLAATRFKALVAKAGPTAADSFKKILTEMLTEGAKKILSGGR
jgi:hypothetical protein